MPMLRFAPLVLVAFLLGGCGLFGGGGVVLPGVTPPSEEPEEPEIPPGPASLTLVGQNDMNAGGNSARVFLYPLGSDGAFLATPIQAFWDDPEGVLGDDLTGTVRDATVRPGTSSELEEVTLDGAPFLGIAADLRAPVGDTWRAVLPASQVRGRVLRVIVSEGGISVRSQ